MFSFKIKCLYTVKGYRVQKEIIWVDASTKEEALEKATVNLKALYGKDFKLYELKIEEQKVKIEIELNNTNEFWDFLELMRPIMNQENKKAEWIVNEIHEQIISQLIEIKEE